MAAYTIHKILLCDLIFPHLIKATSKNYINDGDQVTFDLYSWVAKKCTRLRSVLVCSLVAGGLGLPCEYGA